MPNPQSILPALGLTAAQAPELRSNERNRLLNFLLRWDYVADLHACLDTIIPRNRPLVSLLDLRVQAFLAEGKPQEALPVMQERLALRDPNSFAAQSLLARVYLALNDLPTAHRIAQELTQAMEESIPAWGLLGEVELLRGDVTAATVAYRHINDLNPQSRAYLLGMMDVYRARNDWVTATAYAVRLLRTAEETGVEGTLPVHYLRHLRDHFQASGDATRVADIEAQLAARYAAELGDLQSLCTGGVSPPPGVSRPAAAVPKKGAETAHLRSAAPAEEFLPTFDQIPVSDEERAAIPAALQRLFGFSQLLPGQLETLAAVLRGEDVLTILPTGGGKSLCYQLPAFLAEKGATLVISPLIALMKDQVDSLPEALRARATTINSALEGEELRRRLEQAAAGEFRLVYAAPERLRQPPFLHILRRAGLNRLVIDEAHCVSVWGHDFRPDYLTIAAAREALGRPPLLALTATAPPRVRRDMLQRLGDMRVVAGDVTRPNLHLSVFYAANTDAKLQRLLAFCQTQTGSGIIYAGTRDCCEELAGLLRGRGLSAAHYHAGMDNRARVQDEFMADRVRIVVATVAFGMGIDKPDIRFIVHFVPPPSLEAYYQEAGRAGRDGLPAECLLMYATSDRAVLTRRAHQDLLPVEFLRGVYAAVKRWLNGQAAGPVAAADLERDLSSDDVRVRVALSLLEEAGLLRRGPDMPRSALLRLPADPPADAPADFVAFVDAARLKPRQPLTVNLVEIARQLSLAPDDLEPRLLAWADAGLLAYHPTGRDLSLTLLPPPADAAERVAALLERYTAIQEQRVDEIASYAQTARCRHGYLNAYLGGRTIERCTACDNCAGSVAEAPPEVTLPDDREQALIVLRALAELRGSGRVKLLAVLRGVPLKPARGGPRINLQDKPGYGALAFRSETALTELIRQLEVGGFVQGRTLSHGGVVLELTPAGRDALQDPSTLDTLFQPPEAPKVLVQPTLTGEVIVTPEPDAALLEKLKAWRLALAKEHKLPAYTIFSNQVLEAIAAQLPTTLEALEAIKGIGPRKLEQYGETVVQWVREHLGEQDAERLNKLPE
ncbi:MAG TPA: RecQ family ATP-dependent DNA helicase [Anaerolineae bacterium]|nr:RecQ family ATP-dependent DNA helicase [Anaerolineae bacterium]